MCSSLFDFLLLCLFNLNMPTIDGGPGTAGHHRRVRQTGLAPLPAQVFHPGPEQGDSDETGGALLRLQLLWGRQLRGKTSDLG